MKKRILSLLLAATMLLSLLPMTAFATGTSYAITNGTPENAKETNHGYITIDKETAEESDTLTVEAYPAEGYQLKSLTVTPTISTVADVLATAESDFPHSTTEDDIPDNDAWQASGTDYTKYCCLTYDGNSLHFYCLEGKDISKDASVSQDSGNYVYTDDTVTITFNMTGGVLSSIEFADTATDTWDGEYFPQSQCIAAGTMISMPEGNQKAVEELEIGDVINTFDHETGEVSSAPIAFIWESKNVGNAFTLTFEGDVEVTVIEEHGFYDQEEQKYVFINLQNAEEYIGDHFYNADTNSWLALKNCEALNESIDAYAIITSGDLNHMSNGMLSMCDGTVKVLANIFEYDNQMKFDADKKKADIEAYGLTPKEKILELEGFIESDYDDYNLQYLNVAIGKGLTTWEWIEAFSDYCVENGLVDIYSGSEAAEENEAPKMLLMSATAPKNLLGSAPALTAQDGIEIKANEDGTYQFTMPDYAVTVTAEFEEIPVTIADILPINFPASDEDNSWCNSENDNIYIYKTDSNLVFYDNIEDICYISLSSPLTKEEYPTVNYKYSKEGTDIQFNMTGDNGDELDSIIVSNCTNTSCIGTYAYEAPEAFSVTYNANGATSGSAPANQTKTAGVGLTLATNTGNLAKAGYTFAGWNTKADGSGTHYDTGATYTTDAALTLYAEWIEAPATKTIADILPDDFPTFSWPLPDNVWKNSVGSKMYINNNGLTFGGVNLYNILSKPVTKDGNNYKYISNPYTITFVMDSDKLVKVITEGAENADNNGEYIPSHTHAFTYAANNGKITATCTQGCDKGYDTTPLTLTLTAPANLTYDGNAKAFTFADGEADAWTGAGLELPTIIYNIKQSGQSTYMPLLGILKSVGNYMAQITVDGKDAQVYFTIDKATPYIKTTPAPNDIEYGKKLSDSTLFGGYVQISSTNTTQVGGLFEWKLGDTIPALSDSETTEYDVTFTPSDTNNYNTVSCKVKIKVTHTHNPVLVNGQAATETASGWKDYYKCGCGALFEDKNGTTPIENLDTWKAQGGNIPKLTHNPTLSEGKPATFNEPGYKPYYLCNNCGKYYYSEDATGLIEIPDINAWKAEGGAGYIAKLEKQTDPTDPTSPKTGDTSNMALWVMLMALSSTGLCACLVLGKKSVKF